MKSAMSLVLFAAAAVSAAPALVLDVAASSSAAGVEGLVVKTVLKNTGDETLKLLNDPRTVLSKAPTNVFSFGSGSGSPQFTGMKMKYVPATAAALGKGSDFTVLAPGESIEISHSLAGTYNFTGSGEGDYTFAAKNVFSYVDSTGALKTIEASSNSNRFKMTGKLAIPNTRRTKRPKSKRGVTYSGCLPEQQKVIQAAATASDAYVAKAIAHLSKVSLLPPPLKFLDPRYLSWFGESVSNATRFDIVRSHFNLIRNDATSNEYDCTTCQDLTASNGVAYDSTYAYVYTDKPGKVYLCGAFWKAPVTGMNSQAGTIVHENSHFDENGGTRDQGYGLDALKLALMSPDLAVMNADNHEYFVETGLGLL